MEEQTFVQMQTSKILEKQDGFKGWGPKMDEFPGTVNEYGNYMDAYERKAPQVFTGNAADQNYYPLDRFTQNLIDKYAIEGMTGPAEDGKVAADAHHPEPNGKFYITKETGKKVALEILCTHFKKCGDDGEAFLEEPLQSAGVEDNRWDEAWKYWDVLGAGKIDVVGSSTIFRHLCKPLGELALE